SSTIEDIPAQVFFHWQSLCLKFGAKTIKSFHFFRGEFRQVPTMQYDGRIEVGKDLLHPFLGCPNGFLQKYKKAVFIDGSCPGAEILVQGFFQNFLLEDIHIIISTAESIKDRS